MKKDLLKLFSIAVLFFAALESQDSDTRKYFKFIPEGKVRKCCEEFSEDPGVRFVLELIRSSDGLAKNSALLQSRIKERERIDEERVRINGMIDCLTAQKEYLKQKEQGLPANDEFHIARGTE